MRGRRADGSEGLPSTHGVSTGYQPERVPRGGQGGRQRGPAEYSRGKHRVPTREGTPRGPGGTAARACGLIGSLRRQRQCCSQYGRARSCANRGTRKHTQKCTHAHPHAQTLVCARAHAAHTRAHTNAHIRAHGPIALWDNDWTAKNKTIHQTNKQKARTVRGRASLYNVCARVWRACAVCARGWVCMGVECACVCMCVQSTDPRRSSARASCRAGGRSVPIV